MMIEELAYSAVIPTLFRVIPEAKNPYDASDMPGDPLPYIVFSFPEESLFPPSHRLGEGSRFAVSDPAFLNGWLSAAAAMLLICRGLACSRLGPLPKRLSGSQNMNSGQYHERQFST
jgi:hypothetical protein